MSFDRLAAHYRWMEFVLAGEKLQRCRTAFLDQVPVPRTILLLGEGHGRCLVECVRRFPKARITCVDASERMLSVARRRLVRHHPDARSVKFLCVDALDGVQSDERFDLMVTHFFLDCFRPEQLERIIPQLTSVASPQADWLIADFQNATARLPRIRTRLLLWMMYTFFRVVVRLPAKELVAPDAFLVAAGFQLKQRLEAEWGLLHSDWWQRLSPGP